VQKPFEFANALLSGAEDQIAKSFVDALTSETETQINLKKSIPVYLTYRTVFFDKFGRPQYRADIYGRDAMVYMALMKLGFSSEI